MRRTVAGLTAVAALLLAAPAAFAGATWSRGSWEFSLDVPIGVMTGDSTYRIGGHISEYQDGVLTGSGDVQWPLSELAWPLDVVMASLGGSGRIGPLSGSFRIGFSLTDRPGEMEDSDWGVYYIMNDGDPFFSDSSLDIFSTSDATLDAVTVDLKARYAFLERGGLTLSGGVGLLYEDFSFEARGVDQYSPSWREYGLSGDAFRYVGPENERAIIYDVTYTVPYLEVAAAWRVGNRVTLDAFLGFSPVAMAQDTDDHVLRGKLNEGSCNGTAILAGVDGRMSLGRRFFVAAAVDIVSIDTDGTQTQSYYANPDLSGYEAKLDHTITSTQASLSLRGGIRF